MICLTVSEYEDGEEQAKIALASPTKIEQVVKRILTWSTATFRWEILGRSVFSRTGGLRLQVGFGQAEIGLLLNERHPHSF